MLDNPIARAELAHQRQPSEHWRGLRWLIKAAFWVALVISFYMVWVAFITKLATRLPSPGLATECVDTFTYPLFVVFLVSHFSAILQTLALASNSIAREKRNGTWDTLLITRVDARQLVLGKWWATVRRMWPNFLAAGTLRLGLVSWLGIHVALTSSGYPTTLDPNLHETLLAAATTLLLSVANSGVTAAFGILASLLTQSSGRVLMLAVVLRTYG
jgi:hypothetical protein